LIDLFIDKLQYSLWYFINW